MSSTGTPAAQVFSVMVFQLWKYFSILMFSGHVIPLTMFKQSSSAPAPTPAPAVAPAPAAAPASAVIPNTTPVPEATLSPALWVAI